MKPVHNVDLIMLLLLIALAGSLACALLGTLVDDDELVNAGVGCTLGVAVLVIAAVACVRLLGAA